MGLTSQVHDFNPGITENGLFWTTAIDRGSVQVNLGNGSASLHVADLDVEDYGNVVNALQDGPSVEASVSFDASWSGIDERVKIRNSDTGFAGEFWGLLACRSLLGQTADFDGLRSPEGTGFERAERMRFARPQTLNSRAFCSSLSGRERLAALTVWACRKQSDTLVSLL